MATAVIDFQKVVKVYGHGGDKLTALDGISVQIREGEFVALTGPSGSGKTTLLNLIAGIDLPSSGQLVVAGTALTRLSEGELAHWRSRNVGFIFQSCNLIPVLNAVENVELPLLLASLPRKERRARALNALEIVGLGSRAGYHSDQLCGDEKQRVAIARAIVVDPKVLVADEPTRLLDPGSVEEILALLRTLNREFGKTLVMVTKDRQVADYADRRYQLAKGILSFDGTRSADPSHDFDDQEAPSRARARFAS
jgi:putative ABC transport system ATP-binding protein